MSRRTWHIVSVLVGLTILATLGVQSYQFYQAAEQQRTSYKYQPARTPGFRLDSRTKLPTEHYKPSCNNPDNGEDADLCAQWAAVDQVSEANRLATLNVRLAAVMFFLTAIGTGALLLTLRETRMVSRRELRAYIHVEGSSFADGTHQPTRPAERKGIIHSGVMIKNSGNTPAHHVRHWSCVEVAPLDKEAEMRAPVELGSAFATTLPPNGTMTAERSLSRKLPVRTKKAIQNGTMAVYIYGAVEYLDVFGDSHRTNYRVHFTGIWPFPEHPNMSFCPQGNEAD